MQTCPSCGELVPVEYVTCVWCGYDLTGEHIRRAGIKISRRESFRRAVRVIRDPRNVMKEIALVPDNRGGRTALYLIGLAITFHMLILLRKIDGLQFNGSLVEGEGISTIITNYLISRIPTIAFLVLWPFLFMIVFMMVWYFAARITNYLNRAFGGKSNKPKVRAILGYSFYPALLGYAITIPLRLFTPEGSISTLNYAAINDVMETMASSGIGIVIRIVQILFWLWSMVIAVYGMAQGGRLSYVETFITTGLPYLVFIWIIAF